MRSTSESAAPGYAAVRDARAAPRLEEASTSVQRFDPRSCTPPHAIGSNGGLCAAGADGSSRHEQGHRQQTQVQRRREAPFAAERTRERPRASARALHRSAEPDNSRAARRRTETRSCAAHPELCCARRRQARGRRARGSRSSRADEAVDRRPAAASAGLDREQPSVSATGPRMSSGRVRSTAAPFASAVAAGWSALYWWHWWPRAVATDAGASPTAAR